VDGDESNRAASLFICPIDSRVFDSSDLISEIRDQYDLREVEEAMGRLPVIGYVPRGRGMDYVVGCWQVDEARVGDLILCYVLSCCWQLYIICVDTCTEWFMCLLICSDC
jgi:hypothetical protein